MSSFILQSYRGLHGADKEEIERVLKAKICFLKMSGSDELCFAAPVSLLSCLSDIIAALLHSADESTQVCVNLEVPDIEVFYRFYQFVYTGDYDSYTASASDSLGDNATNKFSFQIETSAKVVDETETRPVFVEASKTPGATNQHTIKTFSGIFGASSSSAPSGNHNFGASTSVVVEDSLFGTQGKVPQGYKLPYSIISCKAVFASDGLCKYPLKQKNKNIADPPSYKSHAISMFLRRHEPGTLWPTAFGHKPSVSVYVLIGHAKIWKFAEKYAISTMMNKARWRFGSGLANWEVNDSTFIIEFGKLVYHSYHGCSAGGNTLQLVIAQFAACIFEDVKNLPGWQELLREVPSFRFDLGQALVEVYSAWQNEVLG